MTGNDLPRLTTAIPGPRSRGWVDRLALRECPAITSRRARRAAALGVADTDPIVWAEAFGANVKDADGNIFVDLTAGFGVASAGHRNPAVVAAGQRQLATLPHAMGDAFADPRRIELMEKLCEITGMDRVILGSSGSDAVEAAIKTALIATRRSRILSFTGGYHGLASAPLAALGYQRAPFRAPFAAMLGVHADLTEFGGEIPDLRHSACVIVEPVQGRGGMREPPAAWLLRLHAKARAAGCLVVHDEIFCGLGRTGAWLASDLRPDLICVGKALGGGFPISACLGTAAVMDAWGASTGQAIHTQTFLGNPVGCAMALASLHALEGLLAKTREDGAWLRTELERTPGVHRVTGRGLMLGAVVSDSLGRCRRMLERGFIALPAGENAEVVAFTPPLTITRAQLSGAIEAMA